MTKIILVMSGKGGVGKTTVAVNLSKLLLRKGFSVGLLDVDIHGPNVLKMLGLDLIHQEMQGEFIIPFKVSKNFKVSSIVSFVPVNSAVVWRGPLKHKVVGQLTNIDLWGTLDYLIVDFPPGTGDEHISTAQALKNISGAVIVSTPQNVSILDTLRSVDFCKQLHIPIIGLMENMSGEVFGSGSVKSVCDKNNLSFLGSLPLAKEITLSCEEGKSFMDYDNKELIDSFEEITKNIVMKIEANSSSMFSNKLSPLKNKDSPKVLVPVMARDENSEVSKHFGHAPFFALFDIVSKKLVFKENDLVHDDPNNTAVDQVIKKFNPSEAFVDNIGKKALEVFNKNGVTVHTLTTKKLHEIIKNLR